MAFSLIIYLPFSLGFLSAVLTLFLSAIPTVCLFLSAVPTVCLFFISRSHCLFVFYQPFSLGFVNQSFSFFYIMLLFYKPFTYQLFILFIISCLYCFLSAVLSFFYQPFTLGFLSAILFWYFFFLVVLSLYTYEIPFAVINVLFHL